MARFIFCSLIILLAIGLTACGIDGRTAAERAYASFEDRHYLDTRVHLANAIDEDPDNPALYRLLGETALALGDGQVAETAFRQAIERDGTLASDVNRYLAHAHLLQGEVEEALALIGEPQDGESYALRLLAQALLQSGAITEAWAVIEDAIEAAPEDANILALAGQYQLSVGNIAEAERFADRALAAPQPSVEAHLLMGRIHSIQGNLEQALAQYDSGIEHFRDHVRLYVAKAAIHADRQETEEMEDAVANVQRIIPGHPGAIYIMARYALNQGDVDRAHELSQGLEEASRNNPPLLLLLGEIQIRRGNVQQGIAPLTEFLRFSPYHPNASLLLANALEESGDSRRAFAVIARAASRASSPNHVVSYAAHLAERIDDPSAPILARRASMPPLAEIQEELARSQQAMTTNDWRSAATVYDRVIEGDFSDHPMLLNNAAMAHLRTGNGERALEMAERAYELAPNDPSVLDTLGWIRLNVAEDRSGSLAILRRAFRLDPGNMQIRLHLAQALAINGVHDEARAHVERLMTVVDAENREELETAFAAILA
ncbi:tetratricopeptide repeat protein [Parasphingopyxis sp.]|uniref:tetratricopeptide repeat protein n=1 Tax=Parasphingopyxis sp. TaxID=1920299 RepID=UPI0026370282|nr:tetratricopeptide repeat protein [Parasphingopyxis sp.]